MTRHPARPAGYRPFVDAADLTAELADIDALTADVFGPDVPLRDRVATLVADWDDYTRLAAQLAGAQTAVLSLHARRGLS